MSAWEGVLDDVEGDDGSDGAWTALGDTSDTEAGDAWGDVLGEGQDGPDDGDGAWDGVIDLAEAEAEAEGEAEAEADADGHHSEEELAIVEQAAPQIAMTNKQLVQQVVTQIKQSKANNDELAIGRNLCIVGALPADARRGRVRMFNASISESVDKIMESRRIKSLSSLADEAGVHVKSIGSTKSRLGAACVAIERAALLAMLDKLTENVLDAGGRCVCITVRTRYDETPLKFRTHAVEVSSQAIIPVNAVAPQEIIVEDKSCSKVVQYEWSGAVLVCIAERYELVQFALPVWLLNVDRCTADVYMEVIRRVHPPMCRLEGRFNRSQKLAQTDGDNSLGKAERNDSRAHPARADMHLQCVVHKIAGMAKGFTRLVKLDITQIIHLALSLCSAGAMKVFRKMLREVIMLRLVIIDGAPGDADNDHREAVLNTFCPVVANKGSSLFKRRMVGALANGRYSVEDVFEHWEVGCCVDEEDTRRKLVTVYVNMVARTACPVFPRHRWTRVCETLRWLGLLAATHNLLPEVYARFAEYHGTKRRVPAVVHDVPPPLPAIADGQVDDAAEGVGFQGGGEPGPGVAAEDVDEDDPDVKRKKQSQHRASGLELVLRPFFFVRLIVLTLVFDAQQELLYHFLEMAGDAWDILEDGKVAMAEAEGMHYKRQSRVLQAWRCVWEKQFMDRMCALLSDVSEWLCIPLSAHLMWVRAFAFRMVTTAGALCHEGLIALHKNWPFIGFAVGAGAIPGATLSTTLTRAQKCRYDPWTEQFFEHYVGRLDEDDAAADMSTTAMMVLLDVSQIESMHAAIRRRLMHASLHTHQQTLEHASSDYVLQWLARQERRAKGLRSETSKPKSVDSDHAEPRGRTHGGGAFRAFIHEQCSRKEPADFGALAEQYKRLSEEEKSRLRELGRVATEAYRRGQASFGMTAREAERARHKRRRVGEVQAVRDACRAEFVGDVSAAQGEAAPAPVPVGPADNNVAVVPYMGSWEDFLRTTQSLVAKVSDRNGAMEQCLTDALTTWAADGDRVAAATDFAKVAECHENPLHPKPQCAPDIRRWLFRYTETQRLAARALAARGETELGKAMHNGLDKDWVAKHNMICHDDVPRIDEKRKPTRVCHEAGMCLCSPEGKVIRYLGMKFLALVKEIFPPDSQNRSLLPEACFGYLLVGSQPARPDAGREGDEEPIDDDVEEEEVEDSRLISTTLPGNLFPILLDVVSMVF